MLVLEQDWMSKSRDLLMLVISSKSNLTIPSCKLVSVMNGYQLRHENGVAHLTPFYADKRYCDREILWLKKWASS